MALRELLITLAFKLYKLSAQSIVVHRKLTQFGEGAHDLDVNRQAPLEEEHQRGRPRKDDVWV
jgi:hypothetical protein